MNTPNQSKHEKDQDSKNAISTNNNSITKSPHPPIQYLEDVILHRIRQLNEDKQENKPVEVIDFQGIEFSIMKAETFLHQLVDKHQVDQTQIFDNLVESIVNELNHYIKSSPVENPNTVNFEMFKKSIGKTLSVLFDQTKNATHDLLNKQKINATTKSTAHKHFIGASQQPQATPAEQISQHAQPNEHSLNPNNLLRSKERKGSTTYTNNKTSASTVLLFNTAHLGYLIYVISEILSGNFKNLITKMRKSPSSSSNSDEEVVEKGTKRSNDYNSR